DRDHALVEIRDTGIGIPTHELEAVFGMFSQLDSPGRGKGGLGIGLALSRRLVEMHGGTATATSEGPGRGTTITVRLPACSRTAPERVSPPAPIDLGVTSQADDAARVLIVDDNVDAANTLADLLSMLGHATRIANDGAGALSQAAAFAPD